MNKQQLQSVVAILKMRFPNLTVEETISIACDIIENVERLQETR